MTSCLMKNTLHVSNDPFSVSLASPTQVSNFESFDPFATSLYPWSVPSTFNIDCQSSAASQSFLLSFGAIDESSHQLTSPLQSPNPFIFEIEPDKTTYETCYDEFLEAKREVIQEISSRGKLLSVPSTPVFIPDIDDFVFSCTPPALSPPSSAFSSSSSSSDCSSGCRTPEHGRSPVVEVVDSAFADSDRKDDMDGDYLPFEFRNLSKPPVCRRLFNPPQLDLQTHAEPKRKRKRKLSHSVEQSASKRQKTDAEVVCRIQGCRHVSKTKFECFKHRETHFPGRFQCPQPDCRKIFVRSSSLSRHLKRERNNACGIFAGPQADWGVGLIKFELCPPPWLAPGYLDNISDT